MNTLSRDISAASFLVCCIHGTHTLLTCVYINKCHWVKQNRLNFENRQAGSLRKPQLKFFNSQRKCITKLQSTASLFFSPSHKQQWSLVSISFSLCLTGTQMAHCPSVCPCSLPAEISLAVTHCPAPARTLLSFFPVGMCSQSQLQQR